MTAMSGHLTLNGNGRFGALKIIGAVAGVLGLVYFGITVGENRRQIDQNREDVRTLGGVVTNMVVANTTNMAKLDEVLRRLERIERKLSP